VSSEPDSIIGDMKIYRLG